MVALGQGKHERLAIRGSQQLEPGPVGPGGRRTLPPAVRLLGHARRHLDRHRGLQHVRPERRRCRPYRHPGLQRGVPRRRQHRRRRRQRQHQDALHRRRQGPAHLLAGRRQARRRLRGPLRRKVGRGGNRPGRGGGQRDLWFVRLQRQQGLDRERAGRDRVERVRQFFGGARHRHSGNRTPEFPLYHRLRPPCLGTPKQRRR